MADPGSFTSDSGSPDSSGQRPSIVLVITDDMSLKLVPRLKTTARHMMRDLGYKFVRYSDANVTTPWCCPSRASLMVGLYTHQHGVLLNQEFPPGAENGGATGFHARGWNEKTIFKWLKNEGYFTALVGRYLNQYAEIGGVPISDLDESIIIKTEGVYFDYVLNENGVDVAYGNDEEDYLTDVLRDKAVSVLQSVPPNQPFLLYFAPFAPHVPSVPAPRHASALPNIQAPRTPAFGEPDVQDKPQWVRNLPWSAQQEAQIDVQFRDAARCVLSVGDALTAIADELEALGRNDVIFIFTDDNGMLWGDHRWANKKAEYEYSVRVLLAIASKDTNLIPRTKSYDHPVSMNVDVPATLLDLAGATPTHAVPGTSLVPTFTSAAPIHTEVYYEHFNFEPGGIPERPIPDWSAIRTPTEKYVELFTGEKEYYRLDVDPYELTNAASDLIHQARLLELAALLEQWRNT